MRLFLTPEALRDLKAQVDWLKQYSPSAARRAGALLRRRLKELPDYPYAWPLVDEVTRQLIVQFGRDGFVAHYRVSKDLIVVVRIFHGRQNR